MRTRRVVQVLTEMREHIEHNLSSLTSKAGRYHYLAAQKAALTVAIEYLQRELDAAGPLQLAVQFSHEQHSEGYWRRLAVAWRAERVTNAERAQFNLESAHRCELRADALAQGQLEPGLEGYC